jgi:hypothetical protein
MSRGEPKQTATQMSPLFAALTGLTSLAILVQAFLAGEFIQHGTGHSSWLNAHDINADVVVTLAVITAIYAVIVLRARARSLAIGAVVLALLAIVQTIIGHAITDSGDNGLIPVHVPLALLIFGLTIWLSVSAARLRHAP